MGLPQCTSLVSVRESESVCQALTHQEGVLCLPDSKELFFLFFLFWVFQLDSISNTCSFIFYIINISLCVAKAVLERNVFEEQRMGRRGNNEECDVKELGFSAMLLQLLCWSVIY